MAFCAMGRMKDGIRSTRASASRLHAIPPGPWASCSAIIPAKGQPGPGEAPAPSVPGESSKASGRWCLREERRCSKGAAGSVRPPTLTPRLRINWVSAGLVSIATRRLQRGHAKVTAREPSSGPWLAWSRIGSSHSTQRNFMGSFPGALLRLDEEGGEPLDDLHGQLGVGSDEVLEAVARDHAEGDVRFGHRRGRARAGAEERDLSQQLPLAEDSKGAFLAADDLPNGHLS